MGRPALSERIDIWIPANELIRAHGQDGAEQFAWRWVAKLRDADPAGADWWRLILAAVEELGRTEPGDIRH